MNLARHLFFKSLNANMEIMRWMLKKLRPTKGSENWRGAMSTDPTLKTVLPEARLTYIFHQARLTYIFLSPFLISFLPFFIFSL